MTLTHWCATVPHTTQPAMKNYDVTHCISSNTFHHGQLTLIHYTTGARE